MGNEQNSLMEKKIPLFIVTGSSGSGKTYVIDELRKILPHFNIFDIDNLREVGITDEQQIRNVWLRVARNTAESGRMTIICGTAMPWDIKKCVDYPYFKHVYYLNLHCDDETREIRLRARNWPEEMIQDYKEFAKWLVDHADKEYSPPMPIVDTTVAEVAVVAAQIKEWVLQYA
ncbi:MULTISPECIES: AAA family ATPase [Paenibacillus]|uniref:AAA family ATPase n=1 Tax=Paenibacillus TaxID=44249 RepID=UPI001F3B9DD4|nr:AAA family ATPase [Paenibacillus glycanilyticus]MCK9859341.1 AAA family ATPase [Paenibacillus sp. ATY16]